MKKIILFAFLFGIAISTFWSFRQTNSSQENVVTSRDESSITRSLSDFSAIDISGGFDKITLKASDKSSIEIDLGGADEEDILTTVDGDHLRISMKKGYHGNHNITMTVNYAKSINQINNSGSSDIHTSGVLKSDDLEFNSSGSGDFVGEMDVKDLDINISGSSDYKISGVADEQEYAISGSGDIHAESLKGKSASVSISGSGDVDLNVSGRIKTSVSGSGNVTNHN